MGKDLALVAHVRRHGEGLSPCPGAQIEHLLARLGAGQQRDHLATEILHLEAALEEGLVGLHVGRPAVAAASREPDAIGDGMRLVGAEARQRLHDPLAARLQRVDAQIERRTGGHGLALGDPVVAQRNR